MGDTSLSAEPNVFKIGEIYERGAWIPSVRHAPDAARQIAKHFHGIHKKHRVRFSKLGVEVLLGDHERAPKPQAMPLFVVVWATVEGVNDTEHIDVAWVNSLRPGDLSCLREATKRALAGRGVSASDAEADLVVGILGPKVARRMLEAKISGQVVDGVVLKAANDVRIGD